MDYTLIANIVAAAISKRRRVVKIEATFCYYQADYGAVYTVRINGNTAVAVRL